MLRIGSNAINRRLISVGSMFTRKCGNYTLDEYSLLIIDILIYLIHLLNNNILT